MLVPFAHRCLTRRPVIRVLTAKQVEQASASELIDLLGLHSGTIALVTVDKHELWTWRTQSKVCFGQGMWKQVVYTVNTKGA